MRKMWVAEYTPLQRELHRAIQKLITNKKFHTLTADECLLVMGRIYSGYCLDALVISGKLEIVEKEGKSK